MLCWQQKSLKSYKGQKKKKKFEYLIKSYNFEMKFSSFKYCNKKKQIINNQIIYV